MYIGNALFWCLGVSTPEAESVDGTPHLPATRVGALSTNFPPHPIDTLYLPGCKSFPSPACHAGQPPPPFFAPYYAAFVA